MLLCDDISTDLGTYLIAIILGESMEERSSFSNSLIHRAE